jgi:hypothetical protein
MLEGVHHLARQGREFNERRRRARPAAA